MATERQPLNTWHWGNSLRALYRAPFVPKDFRRPYGNATIARAEFFGTAPDGPTIIEADGAASGMATGNGLGAAIWSCLSASSGVATDSVTGAAVFGSVGSTDSIASVDGLAASVLEGVGISDGLAFCDGLTAAISSSMGASDGLASCLGVSAAVSLVKRRHRMEMMGVG